MAGEIYRDEAEIREVVRKFEQCEYGLTEFTHLRHVTVACWYLCTTETRTGVANTLDNSSEALKRMRTGLERFIAHHGKQGYHETITRFWIELLDSYLRKFAADTPIATKVNRTVECYGNKEILYSYYTRDRVISEEAKREWIEPDLQLIGSD